MRTFSFLVVLALAFSGCSDGDDGGDGPTTTGGTNGPTGGSGGSGSGTGGGPGGASGNGTGGGASAGDGPQTWYLHASGPCESADFYLDTNDTDGDADGCGTLGVGTSVHTFEATEPSAGGALAEGVTYLVSEGPSYDEVWHVLKADGDVVGESEVWGGAITGLGWVEVPWSVSGDIPAGSTLTLEVHVFNAPTVFLGTEGDHASQFTVS